MPLVPPEQLIWALTNQRHFNVLPRSLRDEVHRHDGRSGNRFFQAFDDLGQRSLKLGSIKLHGHMTGAEHGGSFCSVGQLVVLEAFPVTDGVCWPWTALLIHQRQEQT